ncbi:MAG: histidinol-phosphatase [Methylococcaceae bacterium]
MDTTELLTNPFLYGSTWLRADFHMHTKADREFTFEGEENQFVTQFVEKLKQAKIGIGAITNHNKFDYGEFKALRKKALKEDIFLLPGVELSVNDGANGIHLLVIFSDAWISNGDDHINPFLTASFTGKTPSQYENENGRSNDDLTETLKKLQHYHKDFFVIFAHVEQKNGLWKELQGGRLQELGTNPLFRQYTLGFQKVRTDDDRQKVNSWLKNAYPAEVEGCDGKSLEQIGKGETCYLKLGEFSFAAVKYALLDYPNRVAKEVPKYQHSYIRSVSFEGGVLNGETLYFSPALNSLIGIRGSGKSFILEAIRYALAIPFGVKALDTDYKNKLVEYSLGSGGKVIIKAVDRRGQDYEIRRILNQQPDVYVNGVLQPGISIRETILYKPLYFGQKDLSNTGDGFEKDLVEKLVGEKLLDIRQRIALQKQKIVDAVTRLKGLSNVAEKIKENEGKKQNATHLLSFYQQHGVEEKLEKQVNFDADSQKCADIIQGVKKFLTDFGSFIDQHEDELKNHCFYKSKQNTVFFQAFFTDYEKVINLFAVFINAQTNGQAALSALEQKAESFNQLKNTLKEEFATIERQLSEELQASGVPAINTEEYRRLKQNFDQSKQMLEALTKQQNQQVKFRNNVLVELAALDHLWHEEFKAIKQELEKINKNQTALVIEVGYKADKDAFCAFTRDMFRGSRLRENVLKELTDSFSDFGAIFKNLGEAEIQLGSNFSVFEQYFNDNLSALLTWQVPNSFSICYRGKILKHHSLGQRASALILFILSQQDNDAIIIDQPEDDLDNQTIYEDVIKLIRALKKEVQFIFATHNANFPVLGDAEQVISCSHDDNRMMLKSGSVDALELQQEIVSIMEGGEEAFNKRKDIYQLWKPQNCSK